MTDIPVDVPDGEEDGVDGGGVDPDDLQIDEDDESTFNDWEDETDDSAELDAYADEVAAAVEAFGVPVLEPGESA